MNSAEHPEKEHVQSVPFVEVWFKRFILYSYIKLMAGMECMFTKENSTALSPKLSFWDA